MIEFRNLKFVLVLTGTTTQKFTIDHHEFSFNMFDNPSVQSRGSVCWALQEPVSFKYTITPIGAPGPPMTMENSWPWLNCCQSFGREREKSFSWSHDFEDSRIFKWL